MCSDILLLIAGVFYGRAWLRLVCLWTAIVIFLLAGNEWIARWGAAGLERRWALPDAVPQADAVVVVGQPTRTMVWPHRIVDTTAAGDRALLAFELFRQNKAPLILCTGGGAEPGSRASSKPRRRGRCWHRLVSLNRRSKWKPIR